MTVLNLLTILSFLILSGLLARQWQQLATYRRHAEVHEQALKTLREELQTLMSCSKGIGNSVLTQQKQIRNLLQRQDKLEQLDTGHTHYKQAISMLKRGADNQEITDSCGLSTGELDLIKRLNP